jgi:hypothetical protein
MECSICKVQGEPNAFSGGKCAHCLALENITLKLLASHLLLIIETAPQSVGTGDKTVYKPTFNEGFLGYMRSVISGVNTQNASETKTGDAHIPPGTTKPAGS